MRDFPIGRFNFISAFLFFHFQSSGSFLYICVQYIASLLYLNLILRLHISQVRYGGIIGQPSASSIPSSRTHTSS